MEDLPKVREPGLRLGNLTEPHTVPKELLGGHKSELAPVEREGC